MSSFEEKNLFWLAMASGSESMTLWCQGKMFFFFSYKTQNKTSAKAFNAGASSWPHNGLFFVGSSYQRGKTTKSAKKVNN